MSDSLLAGLVLFMAIVAGAALLSWMGARLERACREALGERLTRVLVVGPAVVLHELSHLLVAVVFAHRIEEVKLEGAWRPGAPAYVRTVYNRANPYHRLGLGLMALAPVVLPLTLLWGLAVAFLGFPGPAVLLELHTRSAEWKAGSWYGSAGIGAALFYAHVISGVAMQLSGADWAGLARGALLWVMMFVIFAMIWHRDLTPWLWSPTLSVAACILLSLAVSGILVVGLTAIGRLVDVLGARS